MKKFIKITTITLCLVMTVFMVTGCGKKSESSSSSSTKKKSKGNCDVFECIKKLDSKTTLEKANEVIGFEGEKLRESTTAGDWTTYQWKLNDDDSVEVTVYKTWSSVKINFKDDSIKNKKVDFSKYDEVKKALNNREAVSYDDLKKKFGGVEGTLIEVTSSGYKYRWVNSEGGYLDASLNLDKTKCSMIMGRI